MQSMDDVTPVGADEINPGREQGHREDREGSLDSWGGRRTSCATLSIFLNRFSSVSWIPPDRCLRCSLYSQYWASAIGLVDWVSALANGLKGSLLLVPCRYWQRQPYHLLGCSNPLNYTIAWRPWHGRWHWGFRLWPGHRHRFREQWGANFGPVIMSMIAWKPYLRVATFHSVNRSVELRSLWISSSLGSDSLIP